MEKLTHIKGETLNFIFKTVAICCYLFFSTGAVPASSGGDKRWAVSSPIHALKIEGRSWR